jgi:hypothetical protein
MLPERLDAKSACAGAFQRSRQRIERTPRWPRHRNMLHQGRRLGPMAANALL